ncbi:adenylate/guanylate cyclase domain-containing protein [Bacteroidota bacterium]
MSLKTRIAAKEWLYMIFAWLFAFYLYYFIVFWGQREYLHDNKITQYIFSGKVHLEFISSSVFFGILFGLINTLTENSIFKRQPLWIIILSKSFLYILGFIVAGVLVVSTYLVFNIMAFEEMIQMSSSIPIKTGIAMGVYIIIVIFIINIFIQFNKKFGPGEMRKILLGKYHKPKEEERVFMFLDLKGSTTLAEKLGSSKYSTFIRQCFNDLSDIILNHQATLYQHIGDEVVITWNQKTAFKRQNAINLFFDFKEILKKKDEYYQKRYGFSPVFKAGMHIGHVTVSETGDLKKEIAYHGDAVNTAARLESQCNSLNELLLVSESFTERADIKSKFIVDFKGDIMLSGKSQPIKVYSINEFRFEKAKNNL